jgi:hypothetical protein
MVSKGLPLDLGTKVYRKVHFVHTGYAVDSTQSINTSLISYKKTKQKCIIVPLDASFSCVLPNDDGWT